MDKSCRGYVSADGHALVTSKAMFVVYTFGTLHPARRIGLQAAVKFMHVKSAIAVTFLTYKSRNASYPHRWFLHLQANVLPPSNRPHAFHPQSFHAGYTRGFFQSLHAKQNRIRFLFVGSFAVNIRHKVSYGNSCRSTVG
jgi:hypothetical protein